MGITCTKTINPADYVNCQGMKADSFILKDETNSSPPFKAYLTSTPTSVTLSAHPAIQPGFRVVTLEFAIAGFGTITGPI